MSDPRTNAWELINQERDRQNAKWGVQNHDDYRWLAILSEEIGELAEAMLHTEFGGHASGMERTELVHVAAVAVQWLECMERRKANGTQVITCEWQSDPDGIWSTQCGKDWVFEAGGPVENEMRYCPICGKVLFIADVPAEDGE